MLIQAACTFVLILLSASVLSYSTYTRNGQNIFYFVESLSKILGPVPISVFKLERGKLTKSFQYRMRSYASKGWICYWRLLDRLDGPYFF